MLDAPVLTVVMGVPAGLGAGLGTRLTQDGSWKSALVTGVFTALFSGAVLGVIVHRKNRQVREAVGELSETQLKHATRASWRGPVPEDPATREAAHWLLGTQLGQLRRQRVWAVLFGTPVYLPRHFQRRAELLENAPRR